MTEEVIGECLQSVRKGMSKISASNSKKILENLFVFKNSGTRYNEMPRDRHSVFVIGFFSLDFTITGLKSIVRYTGVFVIQEFIIQGFVTSGSHCSMT